MPTGPKAPKRPRDPDQLAKSIVALATGEAQDKKLQAPVHEERLDPLTVEHKKARMDG